MGNKTEENITGMHPSMFVVVPSIGITKEELTLLIQDAYDVFHQDDVDYKPLEVLVMGCV